MPELHAVVYRRMRRALVERFPFAVYYRIDADDVVVLAVTHSRRDPKSWQSRA
jgi:plasmid stabilization system protein ParE